MLQLHSLRLGVLTTSLFLFSSGVFAETRQCGVPNITVTNRQAEQTELVCRAVQQATTLFKVCSIPAISEPVRIDVVGSMKTGCVGLYHCNAGLIEVLSIPELEKRRQTDGAFGFLPTDAFFQSLVVHELSHAATTDLPCPFESCVLANEYIAYVMQVMSLDPEFRLLFEANSGMEAEVSLEEINPAILFMAPSVFAQKAWAHFSQREDPCDYIDQLMNGETFIDHDLFYVE